MGITTLGSKLRVMKYCHSWRLDGDENGANDGCNIGKVKALAKVVASALEIWVAASEFGAG